MQKLALLTSFLVNLDLVAAEQIDTWVENPKVLPSGKMMGNGQLILCRQTYDAVISIERYPHHRHPAELLFAQVCAWLIENDTDRDEIAAPDTDVDVLDNYVADVEMTISFEEDIAVVEDENGPIHFQEKRYRLAAFEIDYAEEGDLKT